MRLDTRTSRSASPSLRNDGSASEAPEQGAQVNLRWGMVTLQKRVFSGLGLCRPFQAKLFLLVYSLNKFLTPYIYIYVCVCPACQLRLFLLRVL